jgi:2,6-dihydroxypseudooxynicotine hydrolase
VTRAQVDSVLHVHAGRFVADGVSSSDLEVILSRVSEWDDWFQAWADVGDEYERRAREALRLGRHVSAGEFFWRASISHHYAQFLFFQDRLRREHGQRRKEQLYAAAAPLLVPRAERFDIPIDGVAIPGYLRVPPGVPAAPVVVLIGGLESTKEESYEFENALLRRGLATCTFDGPGQGEMRAELPFQPDFERYCAAVVDWLEDRPEVDPGRVGVLGRSLGGYYAVRSAAFDRRIRACVVWGAVYQMPRWERLPELTRMGFQYVSGERREEDARRRLTEGIDLRGVAGDIGGGLLILHGARDDLIPVDQAQRVSREATQADPNTLWVEPEGNHCCHNLSTIIRPGMADWLAERLAAGARRRAGSGGP